MNIYLLAYGLYLLVLNIFTVITINLDLTRDSMLGYDERAKNRHSKSRSYDLPKEKVLHIEILKIKNQRKRQNVKNVLNERAHQGVFSIDRVLGLVECTKAARNRLPQKGYYAPI